jgi:hypothetical protein
MKLSKQTRHLIYVILREEMKEAPPETYFSDVVTPFNINILPQEYIDISEDLPELDAAVDSYPSSIPLNAEGKKIRLSILDQCIRETEY